MRSYLKRIAARSFHGTIRVLELGEAIIAVSVGVASFFFPQAEHLLSLIFFIFLIALIFTFMYGLFSAACQYDRELRERISDYESQMEPRIELLRDRIDAGA